MEQLLSEIYEKAIYASDMYNELNQKFDEEVETLIQPLKDQISAKELDELRGLIVELLNINNSGIKYYKAPEYELDYMLNL